MPSLNFQSQFVEAIEQGQKRQTIRPIRKNPIKVGDKLYLSTGLRTKKCKRLVTPHNAKFYIMFKGKRDYTKMEFVICKSVEKIFISDYYLRINDKHVSIFEMDDFAHKDGFINNEIFFNFFKTKYGLPFEGVLIKW